MAFFDERFPDCYSFGAKGGPMFSTEVNRSTSGARFANRNWTMPDHVFDISSGIKSEADFAVYQEFFYNVFGRFDAFRFKAWTDYKATNSQLAVIAVGTSYQLQKVYVRGVRSFSRTILKPVSGTVSVRRRSSGGTISTITPSINYATGVVTITGHTSGDTYFWTGEFDVPVNFEQDSMEAQIDAKNAHSGLLINWPTVQVRENRTPG